MFEKLQDRFSRIFKAVKGHGKISEKNISDAVREIRIALLESDVNFKVVSSFINRVKEKASGVEVLDSITPGQQFIKIVLDELISFLSSAESELNIRNKNIAKIVLVGLQGTGKTTTSAKIASFLKKEFNDLFLPIVSGITEYEFSIYDRAGKRIFQTNKTNVGWQGKADNSGDFLPAGAYIYSLIITDFNGKLRTYEGSVRLIR